MNANLVSTWTPILKALPEFKREPARQLIEKYGETYPTGFIVELLEIFGIHTAYLQTVPDQVTKAGEQAKTQIQGSLDAAAALNERTRLELQAIVSAITRTGAGFTKALEMATTAHVNATENSTEDIAEKIQREFERQNLPALASCLNEIQETSARSLKEAEHIHKDAARVEQCAKERLAASEKRCNESLDKLEQLNWSGAWTVCILSSIAIMVIVGFLMHGFFRSRSETILAQKIATASATIEQNKDAFAQLAIADIRLKVSRSGDAKTGKVAPGGFAIIAENAQGAEMRDYGSGKAGFIFVDSPTPEEELHRLQIRVERIVQQFEATKK